MPPPRKCFPEKFEYTIIINLKLLEKLGQLQKASSNDSHTRQYLRPQCEVGYFGNFARIGRKRQPREGTH